MKKIFFCLLSFNIQILLAQPLEWFEGSLVLANNAVLVGEISLQSSHDLVVLQHGGSRMVYPAHQIKSVYFYDKPANINRRYISLKKEDDIRRSYQLYEIVVSGKVSVLRRKKAGAFSNHTADLDYCYFTRHEDGLVPLAKFNRKVFPGLRARSDKRLESFISIHKLSGNCAANAIRIIEFYNELVVEEETLARN